MNRSLFPSLLILSVFLIQPALNAQTNSSEVSAKTFPDGAKKKQEERVTHRDQTKEDAWQKPQFGLVIKMARIGNQATSVGTQFGTHLDNLPGNMANATNFDLDVAYGVYGLNAASLNHFRKDLRRFVFGTRSFPTLGMHHSSPMPPVTEVANDPSTVLQALGFGTQFTLGKTNGNVYNVAPSIDFFGGVRTLRLNISNGFFKRR